MAGKSLGVGSYKLALDASQWKAGAVLTRRETGLLRQAWRETETPAEKLARKIAEVESAMAKLAEGSKAAEITGRALANLRAEMAGLSQAAGLEKFVGQMDALGGAGQKLAAFGGAVTAGLGAAGYAALDSAAKYEQTTIAFATLMGDADAAKDTLARLTDFAASTPFQMPALEKVARGLLGFGVTGDAMIDSLRMMGDAAAATNTDLAELGQVFVKIRGAGKLMGDSFAQLSERGVLFHKDIAAHFGIAESEVAKFVSSGKVGFSDVEQILRKLTSEGGRYNDAMVAQSQSALGLSSTLSDNLSIALRGIGDELLPIQKGFTDLSIRAVSSLTKLDPATRKAVAYTGGLTFAVGAATTATGGLMWGTATLATTYTATTASLAKYTAGKWALAAASTAARVAVGGVAAAAALTAGAMLGRWLHDQTDAAKQAKRVFDDLRGSLEGISSVDVSGASADSLDVYIASTEKQIAKTKEHNAQLEAGKAWWNLWQRNADLIGANDEKLTVLNANLNRATKEKAALAGTKLDGGDVEAETKRVQDLAKAVADYGAKLRDTVAGFGKTAREAEIDRLYRAGASGADLQEIQALDRQLTQLEFSKTIQDQTAAYAKQAAEMAEVKRTKSELLAAQIAEYQAMGATAEQLAGLRQAYDDIAAAEKRAAQKEAADTARKEAEKQQKALEKIAKERESLFKAAAKAVEGIDPEAKFRSSVQELLTWLDAGAINLQQFAKLKDEAAKSLEKPVKVNVQTYGIEGAAAGTMEALARVDAIRQQKAARLREEASEAARNQRADAITADERRRIDAGRMAQQQAREAQQMARYEAGAAVASQVAVAVGLPSVAPSAEQFRTGRRAVDADPFLRQRQALAAENAPRPTPAQASESARRDWDAKQTELLERMTSVLEAMGQNTLLVQELR